MAGSASRAKREREKAREEKQARKRERRSAAASTEEEPEVEETRKRPEDVVLANLAALHQTFEDGQMGFEEFEAAKAELLAELGI